MFGPEFFAFSGDHAVQSGEGFGCECAVCGRAISAPHRFQGGVIWCLYCGFERGRVPLVDVPGGFEFTCGVTREEAASIAVNLGRLDEWAMERGLRHGRLVEF